MHPKKFVKKLLALIAHAKDSSMLGEILGGLYQSGQLSKKEFLKIFALLQEKFVHGRSITISNPTKWLHSDDTIATTTQLGVTVRDGDTLYKRSFARDTAVLLD